MKKLEPEKQSLGVIFQQQKVIGDLYNEHYEMLFKYAHQILQNEAAAEEVIQETFRAVSMNIEKFLKSDNIKESLIRTLQVSIITYLYNKNYKMLFEYACSILRNKDTSQEVVQETFRVACEKIEDLLKSQDMTGWLVRALQFSIKRYKRQKQTISKYIAQVPDDFDFENIVDERLPDEDVKILYSDLAKHKDFDLLTEFAVDGKPIKEIAEKRHISIDACNKRLSRIKKVFRDKISKDNK